ncbi:MAG: hypothetical protein IPJ39_21160 [Saprospiraceae bacterium]|nr:hypothetical protein [Saprospiraceae bacterium]
MIGEKLALTSVDPAAMNVNDQNFGFANIHNGILTVSFENMQKSIRSAKYFTLFSLTFTGKKTEILQKQLV